MLVPIEPRSRLSLSSTTVFGHRPRAAGCRSGDSRSGGLVSDQVRISSFGTLLYGGAGAELLAAKLPSSPRCGTIFRIMLISDHVLLVILICIVFRPGKLKRIARLRPLVRPTDVDRARGSRASW